MESRPETNLSSLQMQRLLRAARTVELAAGTIVFSPSTPAGGLMLIRTGVVQIGHLSSEERITTLTLADSGEWFGTASAGSQLDELFAKTLTPVKIDYLSHADLDQLATSEAGTYRALSRKLADRLSTMMVTQLELAPMSVEQRLTRWLAFLVAHFGRQTLDHRTIIDIPLTQQQLAEFVGVTRVAVARQIASWKENGHLTMRGKRMVLDPTFADHLSVQKTDSRVNKNRAA